MVSWWPRIALIVVLCVRATASASSIDRCIAASASALPDYVGVTVWRIEGTDRQLLALRSYLRNRDTLAERWSWSDEQIASYQRSAEYRAMQGNLAKITARFEELNPGYTLYVNSQVRSLDTQIQRWNENDSVGAAARSLEKAARKELAENSCRETADQKLVQFLKGWVPNRAPMLAAPGLSKHGRARAFDFQIKRGEKIVAGTESSQSISAWDHKGWTRKLRDAVSAAGDKLSGPLQMPYEPWHYEYEP
jgi:hypothetical protein